MRTRINGITLFELLIVVTVAGVALFLAIPKFQDMLEKRRLVAAAQSIHELLNLGLSESMRLQTVVYANFSVDTKLPTQWAVGLSVMKNCAPWAGSLDNINACVLAEAGKPALRTVTSHQFKNISILSANFGDNSSQTCFEPIRRTATEADGRPCHGSLLLHSASGRFQLMIRINESGYISTCQPFSSIPILEFPEC